MAFLYNLPVSTYHRPNHQRRQNLSLFAVALIVLLVTMVNCSVCSAGNLHAAAFPDGDGEPISLTTWTLTLCAAAVVGSTGVLPLLFIPSNSAFKNGLDPRKLNLLLSFAVGGLLGDVFLHLLPETRSQMEAVSPSQGHEVDSKIGLLVIGGMVAFLVAEKVMAVYSDDSVEEAGTPAATPTTLGEVPHEPADMNGGFVPDFSGPLRRRPVHEKSNGNGITNGNGATAVNSVPPAEIETGKISPAGYLNLFANIIDNFTHGLAVAASFLAGHKIGILTTFAIIIHEVPHEVGDFAILLNSGFSRWSAAKAQISTASGALVGAMSGLLLRNSGESVLWVLPFTAGGFLYIALVSVMPELLHVKCSKQAALQVLAMVLGILVMKFMDLGLQH